MIVVLYFVNPIDALPDGIPFLGLTDDVGVFTLIINQIRVGLDRYKGWKQ